MVRQRALQLALAVAIMGMATSFTPPLRNAARHSSQIWSTTEDKDQKAADSFVAKPETSHKVPGAKEDHRQGEPFFPAEQDEMVAYELVDESDDYDLTLTDDKAAKEDDLLKVLRSEVGIKNVIQNSDLKSFNSSKVPNSNELPVEVLIQRTLDTIEDVAVHLRRIPFAKGGQQLSPKEEETRKTVVVLGSGWAAHALMKVVDCRKIRLIVVSPANHFVFHPMLPSAAVGTVEYRSMTEPVRATNPMIEGTVDLRHAGLQFFTQVTMHLTRCFPPHSQTTWKVKPSMSTSKTRLSLSR